MGRGKWRENVFWNIESRLPWIKDCLLTVQNWTGASIRKVLVSVPGAGVRGGSSWRNDLADRALCSLEAVPDLFLIRPFIFCAGANKNRSILITRTTVEVCTYCLLYKMLEGKWKSRKCCPRRLTMVPSAIGRDNSKSSTFDLKGLGRVR